MLSEIGFSLVEGTSLGHGYADGVKLEQELHPLILGQKS